jgi:glycine zipper 2TM protein
MLKTQGRTIMFIAAIGLFFTACAPYQYQGGVAGGAMGGIAGALLDYRNPWRGGVIGAALGAVAGATIADISAQGTREAAYVGRPVEYRTEDRRGYYYAEPLEYDPQTRCRRVRERVYEDGQLMRERVKIVSVDSYWRCPHLYFTRGMIGFSGNAAGSF